MLNMKALSHRIKKVMANIKVFFKSRSKVTVKVKCSKFTLPLENSRHKEHTYQKLISKSKKVMANVKVF